MTNAKTHSEMRQELVDKAAADDSFRHQLASDPKAAIQAALGVEVPDAVSIEVHEENATTAHLVLPPMASLDDADLEAVAGGHRQTFYGIELEHSHPNNE